MERRNFVARQYATLMNESNSTVELRIGCCNLLSLNIAKLPSAVVVVSKKQNGQWIEVGRTETIKNNINPEFSTTFQLQYRFQEIQKVQFRVYESGHQLTEEKFLGGVKCTLGQMVARAPLTGRLAFDNGAYAGEGVIKIFLEELSGNKETFLLKFSAKALDNQDVFSISDPYLEIHKKLTNESLELLYRSEIKRNTLNPSWLPFNIASRILKNSNDGDDVKLMVFDHDRCGTPDLIGEVEVLLKDIVTPSSHSVHWVLKNPKRQVPKRSHKNSGKITLESSQVVHEDTFLDYIFAGLQICFTVGIDFTASNGPLDHPKSLHYLDPDSLNEYQQAITAVGRVIQDYDSDKSFLALGFGAKVPPDTKVSFNFPLNFNSDKPFCEGVQGIMEAYENCLSKVQPNGPTIVAPIIDHIKALAEEAHHQEHLLNYHVLLLITDGAFTDMEDVQTSIVRASRLPMSIIIVGVGNSDFGGMTALDCDDGNLPLVDATNGDVCLRDIVHFVPFRKYQKAPIGILTRQLLAEVPRQITDYFKTFPIATPRSSKSVKQRR